MGEVFQAILFSRIKSRHLLVHKVYELSTRKNQHLVFLHQFQNEVLLEPRQLKQPHQHYVTSQL